MKTFTIGRAGKNDIRIDDKSVSTRHAELVISVGNELFMTDRASTNGTFVWRSGDWQSLRQDFIRIDERLLFGRYEMTVNQLLIHAQESEAGRGTKPGSPDEIDDQIIEGPVRRDQFGRPVSKG